MGSNEMKIMKGKGKKYQRKIIKKNNEMRRKKEKENIKGKVETRQNKEGKMKENK